jgi:uncharacterized Zn finger protein (UPF0148 family)
MGGTDNKTMEQFNTIGSIICPCCGNKLNINQQESNRQLMLLRNSCNGENEELAALIKAVLFLII